MNDEILKVYINDIVPAICKKGTDGNFGSSATKDFDVLQIMSRRIHFGEYNPWNALFLIPNFKIGKFVAEAKFNDPALHEKVQKSTERAK